MRDICIGARIFIPLPLAHCWGRAMPLQHEVHRAAASHLLTRRRSMKRLFPIPLLLVATGCAAAVNADESERGTISSPPIAEFDPANQIIPFPNNLVLNPATGRLAIPPQCGETPGSAAALLRTELNELDGFGTSKVGIITTFSTTVDPNSLAGRVFLFRIAAQGAPLAAPEPVAFDVAPGMSIQMDATCASKQVASVTL